MSSKKCQVRSVKSECQEKLSSKSVLQECQGGKGCQVRVFYKSVLQECQARVSSKKCLTRVSSKSLTRVSSKSVK